MDSKVTIAVTEGLPFSVPSVLKGITTRKPEKAETVL
jgi:hypothetical protein